ncbi:phytoene desaturase family protein [Fluviispira vulneris]|uniref:phytoene desaturase family protein n=1 Tax=Fluviispira vulneris TaxID=2763012 RepID=UPI0016475FEB|nr:phytoene desaturase family protein [Fluviispira vulneris]
MRSFDIAVVGAGFGGLSAALTMQSMGMSVVLIEALDKVGGRAYVEVQQGYRFDRGPSIITAPFLIDDIFQMSGAKREDYCQFVSVDPYYNVVFNDGSNIAHYNSKQKLLEEIVRVSPNDVEGVIAFFAHAEKVFQKGFIELGDKDFSNPMSMLGVAPHLLRLDAIRPVYSLVSRYVKSEKVRQFLSFHPLLIGGNPFRAAGVYSLINRLERAYGVFHPIGGMHALAKAFQTRFMELGGEVLLSSPVESIHKNHNDQFEIQMPFQKIQANKIVVNADMNRFVQTVLKGNVQPKRLARKLTKADYSMSAFLMYFGTNRQWTHLPQHTIALGPRYKELLEDIFTKKIVFDDFSLYLHIPTRTDSSLAPEGGEVIYALVPVANLASGTDWESYKTTFADKVTNMLEDKFLPGLKSSIVVKSIFTPDDFDQTLQSHLGNAFGLEPWILQSAGFRPSNKSKEVEGLYFVGANTQPGAGLPGVLLSSRITCRLVAQDEGLKSMPALLSNIKNAFSYVNPN